MTTAGQPYRGMRFLHARQIDGQGRPEVCEVTKVRQGTVYFRNSTGFLSKLSADRFPATVKEILPADGKADQ